MKRRITLTILILILGINLKNVYAQDVPRIISYQGVLVDQNGKPISGTKNLSFTLVPRNGAPNVSWSENIAGVSVNGGLFFVPLGLTNSFPTLNGHYDLGVTVDGNIYQIPLYSNVYSLNIPDGIVTDRKLSDNSVNSLKIIDGSVGLVDLAPAVNAGEIIKWNGTNWVRTQDDGLRIVETASPFVGDGTNSNPVRLTNGNRDKQFLRWNQSNNNWEIIDDVLDSNNIIKIGQIRVIDYRNNDFENIYIGSYISGNIDSTYLGGALVTYDHKGNNKNVRNFGNSKAGILGEGKIYSSKFELKDSSNSFAKAGIRFDNFGNPEIWSSGTKPFIVPDPTTPNRNIKYTAIEGPEAGMYYRGKIKLINGFANIELPEHFIALANNESITVSLTPHSLKSLGVAVDNISLKNVSIGELQNGKGNYEVSYFISAIRKGYENYEVYQIDNSKSEMIKPVDNILPSKVNDEVK